MIRPTLELLGWTDYLPRQGTNRNEDNATSKGQVVAPIPRRSGAGYACAVEESKGLGLPLDARDKDDKAQANAPHNQITPIPVYS